MCFVLQTAMEMASSMRVSLKPSSLKRYCCVPAHLRIMSYTKEEALKVKCASVCALKLEKVYNPENEEDDMVEMEEERLRMREHVMNEVSHHSDRTDVCVIDTEMISPDQA